MQILTLLTLLSTLQLASSYNFLVVSPIFAYSHIKFMSKVADTLADGGHSVTLLQTYMFEHWGTVRLVKNENVKIIDYRLPGKTPDQKESASKFKYLWDTEIFNNVVGAVMPMFVLFDQFKPMCESILKDKYLHEKIVYGKFDGFVAEAFDFCSLYLGDHLKQNLLPMFSSVKNVAASSAIGEPSLLNYAPTLRTKYGAGQSLWDRLQDVSMVHSFYYALGSLFSRQHSHTHALLKGDVRHWKEILQTSTFFFCNNNPYIGFPMPALEKSVDIGGFTVDPKKSVPVEKEYDEILSLRESNVLISFGTVVLSADMPEEFKDGIVSMFENLPEVTFIWKYEVEDEKFSQMLPENVFLKKWVPQPALLADSRLSLFITHGGLGSITEVAYSGKPSIIIPVFGDQLFNAKMLSRHGGAKEYNKYDLAKTLKLTKTIRDVLSTESFSASAHRLAEILQNQPIDPKTNLLRHAEFSAKFGRVQALEPYNVNYNFIQYYMLDAYFVIIFVICAFVYMYYRLAKTFCQSVKRKLKKE